MPQDEDVILISLDVEVGEIRKVEIAEQDHIIGTVIGNSQVAFLELRLVSVRPIAAVEGIVASLAPVQPCAARPRADRVIEGITDQSPADHVIGGGIDVSQRVVIPIVESEDGIGIIGADINRRLESAHADGQTVDLGDRLPILSVGTQLPCGIGIVISKSGSVGKQEGSRFVLKRRPNIDKPCDARHPQHDVQVSTHGTVELAQRIDIIEGGIVEVNEIFGGSIYDTGNAVRLTHGESIIARAAVETVSPRAAAVH